MTKNTRNIFGAAFKNHKSHSYARTNTQIHTRAQRKKYRSMLALCPRHNDTEPSRTKKKNRTPKMCENTPTSAHKDVCDH